MTVCEVVPGSPAARPGAGPHRPPNRWSVLVLLCLSLPGVTALVAACLVPRRPPDDALS